MSRPRVLFVGRGRFRFPLGRTLERRFEAPPPSSTGGNSGLPRREAIARLAAGARASVRDQSARRSSLLLAAAATDRARAPWFPAGRRHRAGRAGGGSRAHRSAPHAIEDRGDPRSPRRLARAGQALRVEGPPPTRSFRRRPRTDCVAPHRRGQDDQRVHDRAGPSGGHRAHGRVPGVHGPRALHGAPGRAASGRSRGALRRCARAVQGFRRACRCVAPSRPGGARSDSARRRSGCAGVDGTAARGRAAGSHRVESVSDDSKASRPRSTRRRCSCSRLARRGWGAWWSKPRAVAGPSWAAAWAAYRTSSWTARQVYSSRPTTRERWLRHSSAYSPIERSRSVSARQGIERSRLGWRRLRSTHREFATSSRRSSRPHTPPDAYTQHDARGPGEAAPEERDLPRDRRNRERCRHARRRGRADVARADVPQGQRPLAEPDHGSDERLRRADDPARRARLPRLARRRPRALPRGAPVPAKAVLLTFDDGYRDNLENALPILRRTGTPRCSSSRSGSSTMHVRYPTRSPCGCSGSATRRSTGTSCRARGRGRADRVARDRPPAALRARACRGGSRDRPLEAPARGASRPRSRAHSPT